MGGGGIGSGGGFVAKGFSPGILNYHYARHKGDFKNIKNGEVISKEEYQKKAKMLLNSPVKGSIKGFTDTDGTVYRFNTVHKTFGMCAPSGYIITFFKPAKGYAYYKEKEDDYKVRTLPLLRK